MTSTAYHTKNLNSLVSSGNAVSKVNKIVARHQTTALERFLLVVIVIIFPMEDHIPAIGPFSITFILFALLASYTLLWRKRALFQMWLHPVFLAGYGLLVLGFGVESLHSNSSYSEIIRIALMLAGAIFVASLCRDRRALRWCIFGFLVTGVAMSVLLFLTMRGSLTAAGAGADFGEASKLRAEARAGVPLRENLNGMAYMAAQGAAIALALIVTAKASLRRKLLLAIMLICSVATFLPMSRSGILMLALAIATIMYSHGINGRIILMSLILVAGIVILVPSVVFSRLTFSREVGDIRADLFSAVIEHFPEYVMTGVGAGNFYGNWGIQSGFGQRGDAGFVVIGSHNGLAQVTIYWGWAGCLALMTLVWQAYRCLPRRRGSDALSLCVLGLAVAALLSFLSSSEPYGKLYSLVLGILVAGRYWIWPRAVYRVKQESGRIYAQRIIPQ